MQLVGRRNFLAGMGLGAGGTLLGSLFSSFLPEAQGAALTRRRFLLVTNANGFLERHYTCASRSATDFDLTEPMAPLAPWKSQLVVAHKFYNPFDKALHGNQYATLSVLPSENQSGEKRGPPGGISLDRFLAKTIGASDPFPSTVVGVSDRDNVPCTSADGKGQAFPAIGNPVKAFETYFGRGMGPGGASPDMARVLAADKSLLDFVSQDVGRMSKRLAGAERAKLDQYLTSLRGVERTLQSLGDARASCQTPTAPDPALAPGQLRPEVVQALVDVTVAAQVCGLTRVSHVSILAKEGSHVRYAWLGDGRGHHNTHHANDLATLRKIDAFVLGRLAQMAEGLSKVREGDGTMLDNSLIAYVNCCGGSHHRGHDTHAVITLGRAGGAIRTGRYLTYPLRKHCISDAYVAMANAVGARIDKFGAPEHCQGPLPGLLA